ncbi:MAG: hypothetical protein HZC41_15025 [Chloroflexi bacterium]|nr:hypothetical protein [Chloroflexota bacterium]
MPYRLGLSLIMMVVSLLALGAALMQADQPTVWLSTQQSGTRLVVDVSVSGARQAYGWSFRLAYDTAVAEVVGDNPVEVGSFTHQQPNFVLKNTVEASVIDFALTLTQPATPVDGDGILGTVTFEVQPRQNAGVRLLDARLVTPRFVEVDGQQIAEAMEEVPVTLIGSDGSTVATVPSTEEVQRPVRRGPVSTEVSELSLPETVVLPPRRQDIALVVVAITLFLAGLALFTVSVSAYVSLRLRLAAD